MKKKKKDEAGRAENEVSNFVAQAFAPVLSKGIQGLSEELICFEERPTPDAHAVDMVRVIRTAGM